MSFCLFLFFYMIFFFISLLSMKGGTKMLCGWLSPYGSFYPCDPYGHIQLAEKLIHDLYQNTHADAMAITPDEMLLHSHWIKLFCDGLHIQHITRSFVENKTYQITDPQIQWIMKYQKMLSSRQERCLSIYLEC